MDNADRPTRAPRADTRSSAQRFADVRRKVLQALGGALPLSLADFRDALRLAVHEGFYAAPSMAEVWRDEEPGMVITDPDTVPPVEMDDVPNHDTWSEAA